jgi:hypothetical protein
MGLAAGTYTAVVTVRGGSGISADFTVSFTVNDITPPAGVSGLTGSPGDGEVSLTWTDPAEADLDHIEITWSPGGTTPQSAAKSIAVDRVNSKTITGLANGTAYTFTVTAVDAAGNRSGGVPSAALTPQAPTGVIKVEFTGLPQDETIILNGVNDLSWSANTALNVSVSESFDAYRWDLDGLERSKTTAALTLNAAGLLVKKHTLTVFVKKNGVEYAKILTFTVTP